MLCQRVRDSAFIGHDYHAATRAELHSSRLAQIERWTEVGHRHPAWNAVCRIETRDRRAHGRDGYRSRRFCGSSCGRCLRYPLPVARELNYMRQCWEFAQFEILIARNVVYGPYCREHLRLLDCVYAEVRFQIKIQVQHILGIAGLLHHQLKDAFLHGFASAVLRRCRRWRWGGWLGCDGSWCGYSYLGRLW